MKIGEVAEQTGLAVSNIRFYEKKGLLTPDRKEESKYREFSKEDVERLKKIVVLRKAGISIESIGLLLEEKVSLQETMEKQETELQEQMKQLEGAVALCNVLKSEASLKDLNADRYLNFMEEEEKKGNRFSEAAELVEDLSYYTGEVFFPFNMTLSACSSWKFYPVVRTLATILYWLGIPALFVCVFIMNGFKIQSVAGLIGFIFAMGLWLFHLITFFCSKRRSGIE